MLLGVGALVCALIIITVTLYPSIHPFHLTTKGPQFSKGHGGRCSGVHE